METKRAIEVLRQNAEFVDAEFEDAIAIAISALEKQEKVVDASCETCKYKSHSAQEIPCCDCYMASCFEDCYEPYTEEEA